MKIDNYLPALEAKLGTIVDVQECCPGAYDIEVDIEVDEGARFHKRYYVLTDDDGYGYLAYLDLYGR